MNEHLKCCSNCKNCIIRYFIANKAIKESFRDDLSEHDKNDNNFSPACNLIICKAGHYPKHADRVCADWEFDCFGNNAREID